MSAFWLSVDWPLALWGLLLCPLLLFMVIRSRAVLSRFRLISITAIRLLVVVFVVLALAGARANWPTEKLAVATIFDSSSSVSSQERDALVARASWLAQNNEDVAWTDLSNTMPAPQEVAARSVERTLLPEEELGNQVSSALALLPRDRVRRIVVATDGRGNEAKLRSSVEEAAADGASVYLLPMGERPAIDQVAIVGVELPRLIRAGESASVKVQLYNHGSTPQNAMLAIELDGQQMINQSVVLPPGRSVQDHQVTFRDEGVRAVNVQVVPGQDRLIRVGRLAPVPEPP